MEMIEPQTMVHRDPRVVFRQLSGDEGGVLLHLDTSQYHAVNAVGAAIWGLIEDGPSFGTLVARLQLQIEDPPDGLSTDVEGFLSELSGRGLIQLT
jgi:hypothetical protein